MYCLQQSEIFYGNCLIKSLIIQNTSKLRCAIVEITFFYNNPHFSISPQKRHCSSLTFSCRNNAFYDMRTNELRGSF